MVLRRGLDPSACSNPRACSASMKKTLAEIPVSVTKAALLCSSPVLATSAASKGSTQQTASYAGGSTFSSHCSVCRLPPLPLRMLPAAFSTDQNRYAVARDKSGVVTASDVRRVQAKESWVAGRAVTTLLSRCIAAVFAVLVEIALKVLQL